MWQAILNKSTAYKLFKDKSKIRMLLKNQKSYSFGIIQSDAKWRGKKAGQIMADPKPVFARIENRKDEEDEVVHKVVNDKKKPSRSQGLVQARQQYLALSTIAGRLLVDAEKAHDCQGLLGCDCHRLSSPEASCLAL